MGRRTGSGAALVEDALVTAMGKNPPKASAKLAKAAIAAGYDSEDGSFIAIELPKREGVSEKYVAPQLDAKGRPTVEGGGGKSWRSVWFSLTVNSYRRDGDGPAVAIALANSLAGEPFVTYNQKVYLLVTTGMVADARKALRA